MQRKHDKFLKMLLRARIHQGLLSEFLLENVKTKIAEVASQRLH